jgi:hypothetical protein
MRPGTMEAMLYEACELLEDDYKAFGNLDDNLCKVMSAELWDWWSEHRPKPAKKLSPAEREKMAKIKIIDCNK